MCICGSQDWSQDRDTRESPLGRARSTTQPSVLISRWQGYQITTTPCVSGSPSRPNIAGGAALTLAYGPSDKQSTCQASVTWPPADRGTFLNRKARRNFDESMVWVIPSWRARRYGAENTIFKMDAINSRGWWLWCGSTIITSRRLWCDRCHI